MIKIQLAGIPTKTRTPILSYCRRLVAEGVDPATALHVHRDDVLAIKVRSIGEGARLTVKEDERPGERVRFAPYKPFVLTPTWQSPVRKSKSSATAIA